MLKINTQTKVLRVITNKSLQIIHLINLRVYVAEKLTTIFEIALPNIEPVFLSLKIGHVSTVYKAEQRRSVRHMEEVVASELPKVEGYYIFLIINIVMR